MGAAKCRVEDVGYSVPSAVWALTAGITVTGGVGTAWLLDASLGALPCSTSAGFPVTFLNHITGVPHHLVDI